MIKEFKLEPVNSLVVVYIFSALFMLSILYISKNSISQYPQLLILPFIMVIPFTVKFIFFDIFKVKFIGDELKFFKLFNRIRVHHIKDIWKIEESGISGNYIFYINSRTVTLVFSIVKREKEFLAFLREIADRQRKFSGDQTKRLLFSRRWNKDMWL